MSILETFPKRGRNISNAFKLQFSRQPFEIIQGEIAFKNTVQCVNEQTVAPCVAHRLLSSVVPCVLD